MLIDSTVLIAMAIPVLIYFANSTVHITLSYKHCAHSTVLKCCANYRKVLIANTAVLLARTVLHTLC